MLIDLRSRFDEVLAQLESVAGWRTARINRPVQILGNLDGIETGVRQLIRQEPLETRTLDFQGQKLTLPSEGEILRIKAALILRRNATRDYIDFAALVDLLGVDASVGALGSFDHLYPQENGQSALQQLQIQLSNPMPYDLEDTNLAEYKGLSAKWHDWRRVQSSCADIAVTLFDWVCDEQQRERNNLRG